MRETILSKIELLCEQKGLRLTEQRKIIARVLSNSKDHPDVHLLHKRALEVDDGISIATVYRTMALLEDEGLIEKHEFGNNKARYEEASDIHHDHIINIIDGSVIEFHDEKIEELQKIIAQKLGFELISHKLELYCKPFNVKE